MDSFKLDSKNNIMLEGGFSFVTDKEALRQDLNCKVHLQKTEYIYDTTRGVDWIKYLQEGDEITLLNEIETEIYTDERVVSLKMASKREGKTLSLDIYSSDNEEVEINISE